MTNINFLSNLVVKNEVNHVHAAEKNEVNRAPAAAKRLQIAGGGASRHEALIVAEQFSQSCVLRSEGAQHRVLQSEGARYNVLQSEGTQKERSGRTMYKAQKENTHEAELFGYHGAFIPDGHPTADRQSCMTPVGDQRGVKRQNDHELPLTYPLFAPYLPLTYTPFDTRSSVSRQSNVATRVWKYAACVVMLLVMSVGQMWGETIFEFTVKNDVTSTNVTKGTPLELNTTSHLSTLTGGTITLKNTNSSAQEMLKTQGSGTYKGSISMGGNDRYIIVTLSNALEKGDVITGFTSAGSQYICLTSSESRDEGCKLYPSGSSSNPKSITLNNDVVANGKNLIGAKTLYIWRGGGNTYVHSLTITRESSCGSTEQTALSLSLSSGTVCAGAETTFTVSGGSGIGALSVSSSDPSKATASIDGTTVTVTGVAAGSATITVTKACDATYAEATATYSATVAAVPTANAGADKTTELETGVALAATAAASGCAGAWTIVSGPNTATSQLSNTSSATATFTPTAAGTYTLRWTVTNTSSSCSAYDDMTVTAATCAISSCGNATLTYAINASTSVTNTAANLISSATASNTTAMGINGTAALSTITIGSSDNAGKAAAATSTCYPTKPTMSSKIGMYSGSSYSSSNYLQFGFIVKSGYTFTPCDIQFTVQPVSSAGNFRWEITDGTNSYGYGVATDVPKGGDGGASVLTGLGSTAEMEAGTYYIRLYPYDNESNTFRISNNVILKGTTAAVASDAYDIHIGKNNADYTDESLTNTSGTTWSKDITLDAGSYYEFKVKKTPSVGEAVWYGNNGKITATTSPAWDFSTGVGSNCKLYTSVAGSYTFSWDASTSKLTVTYPAGEHPTKRIYMACGDSWCNDSPKFFVHSWGVSDYNTQVQQNACGEYYADIIWYNDYFQFTRNASNATAYDNNKWNESQDLTYNSSQTKWTCTGWSDGKGTFSSSAYSPDTYTVTAAASTAGYGTVSAASVTGVACGTSISTSTNTLTVGATSVTATATESTAQYTYAFTNWTWTPAGSTVTSDVTATANFTRTLNSYTVTWKNGATTLETDASVNYGATPSYDGSTPTKDADALYTYTFSGWSPAIGTVTGDATYSAQFTATPKTVAYGDATIYAYNDSKRVVSGTRKTAMVTALADSDGETGIFGSLPLLHSVAGLTSVVLAGQCKSEVKASFPWLGSYIKMKTASTTATITFNVASGYAGTATIYFSGYNKTATLTNGANSEAKTSDSKNPETEGSFTSKNIALVSGANTLTISGNNGYISRIDVALEAACTSVAAPTSLSCSAQTSSSLTFTWTKAANASGYTATLYSDAGCTSSVSSQDLGDVNTVTFNTLTANTTYYCKVQSNGDGSTYCAAGGTTSAQSGTTDATCSAHELAYATASVEKNVGDAAFTNTLTNPHSLVVTYSSNATGVATVNATSGLVSIVGAGSTTITATWAGDGTYCAGTATYTLTVSSDCTPQSLVKTVMSSTKAGTTTGYNDGEYAGEPVIATFEGTPIDGGYKLKSGSKLFVTLKKGNFVEGDKINIVITKASDLTNTTGKLLIFYNASTPTLLKTIDAASAGTYTYTLTDADITTLGSTKTIGVFRSSGTTENNPYVKSVEVAGCREWEVCTAPDAVAASGATHNSALLTVTDAAATGNYEFYYSTSSTAPTASTAATATGSSLTNTITGLSASTTYYYWVRSNCGGVTKSAWVAGMPATFTTTATPSTYNVTYDGNGKTSGSVPTDATAYEEGDIVTALGNTGSLVKTGQTFLGWSTNATASSGTFYPAGYKFYMGNANVTLYAVWGSVGATCVTLTNFETSSYAKSSNKPDSEGKYFYGYKGTVGADYAVTITTPSTDVKGANSGANLLLTQNTRFSIYADNTTTGGTPATFSDVTAVSFKIKANKNTKIPTIDVYVGSTKIKTVTGGDESKSDGHEYDTSGFTTITISGLSNLAGIVKFVNTSSGSSDYKALFDDIQICYGSGASSGHTVSFNMNGHGSAIADIENVPDGSKIGAPVPAPTATDWDFGGWYNEEGCSSVFNFASTTITADKILYAKWSNCAPTITTHPVAANYNQNDVAAALTVAANNNGGGELHYQWWVKENDLPEEDGSAIPGETGTSFTPSTMLLGTSYYYCVVSNDCGNVKTNTAAVTITDDRPDPKAVWTVAEPTHGGKGFTFSVAVKKNDNTLWDGTLEASMLTLSSEAVLGDVSVDNDTKIISGTYGVKGSATSPVTFYLLLPATDTQAAKRLDYDRSFTECVGGSGDSYDIRVRKNSTHDGNYYHWANTDGWISPNISNTINSEKASSKMGASNQFDSIYNSNTQYVWVRTYHANINKVRIYADFRANDMTVSNVYKHTGYFTANDKYIVSYTAVYNGNAEATNLGDANQGYVDITLEEPMNANDIVLVKFNNAKVRPLGAVLTEARSGGSLETALVWSNSQASGTIVAKSEDELDFTITANRSGANALASLGTINYSSSVPSVATINAVTGVVHIADNIDFGSADNKETTITALLNPSGCYKRSEITYVLRVNKHVCTEAAGTIGVVDRGCAGMDLTITGYEDGATVQWYKDGSPVGTNSATYNATEPGEYHAVTTKTCAMTSTNSVVLAKPVAEATKIVDSWYIKNGRRTPDIALVQTTNATGFTVTSGGSSVTNIGGCTFELKDDGIIYLHGTQDNGDAPSGMTPGDMTITITATACSNATPLDIVLHIQAETVNPSIAFVVDGTLRKDGGTATSVLAAKTSERPIWKYLANTFALTGCNAYWSVDSKELRQYYSQFDAILITDDPNTSTNGTGGVSYVKALGTMVDVRPVLTMEAYVGKFKDGGWHVYDATPSSPNPRQVEMKLECKNHDIFKGLNPATSDNVRMTVEGGNEYWHIVMVDTTLSPYHNTTSDYEALPALQGFDATKFSNMLGVGTIFNEKLQGGVERQEEPAARMMILGIQNNAMAALTNEGKLIVKNALDYLLKTNMEDVNDCSNYFTGAEDDQWNNLANWTGDALPDFETRARILRPVVVPDGYQAVVARVDIATSGASKHVTGECNGSVTINPTGALIVGGKIRSARAPQFGIDDLMPTENSDLVVKASTTAPHNQGALIFNNTDGDTHAVVEMWNPSHWVMDGGKKKKYWSYVAVPIQEADIPNFFWNGFTYLYDETSGWIKKGDGTVLYPFQGIGASLQTGNMETFYGPLASTDSQDITLTYTADKGQGMNLIGNSWTAPIQIANFEEDDFGDAAAEVWVFNTGHTNGGHSTMADGSSGTTTAGQWQTIPIGVAGLNTYTGLKVVPAMQAFEVNTSVETTLHLDYDRLVRAGRENLNEPMRTPRRGSAAKQIEATMRVRVSGELTHTDVYLLKDARFSDAFDNGWDGHYLSGDDRSARLYALSETSKLAFLAQPEIDGTQLGFVPGRETEYMFSFFYDGDATLYLNDLKEKKSTLISEENTYSFTYEEGDEANRFLISGTPFEAPQTPTDAGQVPSDQVHGTKVLKVIYQDKVYIIRGGKIYDIVGKVVK